MNEVEPSGVRDRVGPMRELCATRAKTIRWSESDLGAEVIAIAESVGAELTPPAEC